MLRSALPDAKAWATAERIDKLRTRQGLPGPRDAELRKQFLGDTTLDELWPAPAVHRLESCDSAPVDSDCDEDEPLYYDIADVPAETQSLVAEFLWEQSLSIVGKYAVFGVDTESVRRDSEVLGVRRSKRGFELQVRRSVGGYEVAGGPQRLKFSSEGVFLGFNKGFITNQERGEVALQASRALDADASAAQAHSKVLEVWKPGRVCTSPASSPVQSESMTQHARA